jgi:hypothetical protein
VVQARSSYQNKYFHVSGGRFNKNKISAKRFTFQLSGFMYSSAQRFTSALNASHICSSFANAVACGAVGP